MPPTVSVVMATYNRSNVLRYAIETVRWQTFQDWELIVVGDACTDDSGEVVEALGDPRIRWVNRRENWGDQSGPNNDGIRLAAGRYIAFLNHDDFWFPDHLALTVQALDSCPADLVFTAMSWYAEGRKRGISGVTSTGRFDPYQVYPASSWVFRRELVSRVGEWKAARDCYEAPSQEWLWRAYRAGAEMYLVPALTVFVITSVAGGPGSYLQRAELRHRQVFEQMRDEPDFREHELTALALAGYNEVLRPRQVTWHVMRALKDSFRLMIASFGLSPHAVRMRLRYLRKGGFVAALRKTRGLGPLPRTARVLDA